MSEIVKKNAEIGVAVEAAKKAIASLVASPERARVVLAYASLIEKDSLKNNMAFAAACYLDGDATSDYKYMFARTSGRVISTIQALDKAEQKLAERAINTSK